MSTTHTTQDGIAPRSNDRSRAGSVHTAYISAATLFNEMNVGAATETREGPEFTLPREAKVIVRLKCDDSASLSISQIKGSASLSVAGELGDWTQTDTPSYWPGMVQGILPAGSYKVTGTCTNIDMDPYNADNRMFLSYEILAEFSDDGGGSGSGGSDDDVDDDKEVEPPICNPCGCCSEDGDETNPPADDTPASAGEECGGSVGAGFLADAAPAARSASGQQTGLRYQSVWRWMAALQDGVLTIRPTSGRRMTFSLQEGSAEALPTELTRHHDVRVQLQHADLSPCTTGEPAFWTLVEASGRRVRFDAATGTVAAVVAASGKVTSAADHAAQVQEVFDEAGNMVSCYSPAQGLMLASTGAQGEKLLAWYAPADVSTDAEGRLIPTGEPYKTSSHVTTLVNGVETTTVTRQQAGLPPHTVTRVVEGDSVTVTKGSGAEAIIRTWVTTHPEVGTTQTIETLRRGSAESEPVSCSCTVRKMTAGGWLTQSETEGYGSPLARTTLYDYNEQFRVSRITRPDGGYTEFAYDADGRVTQELSPWGQGGLQRTRYVYPAQSSRFYDTRPIKVYTDYKPAEGAWLNIKVVDYTYEDSADVERTTATTYAAGVNHQQVTIEERFGEAPAYAYAAGKPKFAQDAAGVQTRHEYAPTTLHGAVHLHTVTTMAAGVPVPAHSRKTEEFLAADDTVIFEQESIWDGAAWQLVASTAYEYDAQRRPVKTTRGHGRLSTATWMCCGKLSETDEDGVTTTYGYDSAHQLVESIRAEVQADGVCITPETIVTYTRDAAGRVLETRRDTGAMTTVESVQYDILGREISRTDALGRITTTAYSEDGLTTTVTTPTGATLITTRHTDGSPAAVGGTGQRALVYEYGVQGHLRCDAVKLADDAGTLLSQTLTNGFGQVVQQLHANTSGSGLITHSEYNARGLLVKQWQSSGEEQMAPTLFEYDSFGHLTRQTLALAEEPTSANSSITELAYSVESTDEGVFSCTTQTRYNATGGLLVSVQKQLISQLSPTLAEKVISISERGLTSADWVVYNNSTKRTRYSAVPTSDITAETVVADGFTLSQKDTAGVITTATRAYTAGGMVLVHTDGRGNATTTVTDIAGRTLTVTDAAGNVTTTTYGPCCDQP
ncbi:MAG: RHS repeat protein, partial [Akkermansia sp.]|nr:RHS repeat protein [Akkermansia sp.]